MNLVLGRVSAFLIVGAVITGTIGSEPKSVKPSNLHDINSEECGPVKIASRITGGKIASLGQYPWMARLGYETDSKKIKYKCGASLINRKYIITAAHCIQGHEKKLKVIRLGEHFTNTTEDCVGDVCAPPVQDFAPDKIQVHPKFDHNTMKNDISIIRLSKEVQYNDFVKPICIPQADTMNKSYVSQHVEIAGWGVVNSDTQAHSNTLLYVSIPVRDLCACANLMPSLQVDHMQFCVGLETGEDSCTGDSGGPLMKMERIMGKKKYYLLGVVSIGKSYCGEAPAVYTNVVKYLDWILEMMTSMEQSISARIEVSLKKEK